MRATLISIPAPEYIDTKSGWKVNYALLERIRETIQMDHYRYAFDVPSLEEIEAILLILMKKNS